MPLPRLVPGRLVHLVAFILTSIQFGAILCPSFLFLFSFGIAFLILVMDFVEFALLLLSEGFHKLKDFLRFVGGD